MDQIWTGFHMCLLMPACLSTSHLPRPFKLPSFFFLIMYVFMLFAARVHRVPAVSVPLQQHVCAVHGRACRCCVCFWPLASLSDWAAYQTGCALGAEFVSRHRPCQLAETGGWMDCGEAAGLASNFLTQKLSPRRFPLLPPQHSYSTHTLSIPLTSAGEANKQSLQWQHKETRSEPLNAASPHWLIVLRW